MAAANGLHVGAHAAVHRASEASVRRIIHDMRADGVLENGVNDVTALNCQPIEVAAEFTDGQLQLRPSGGPVLVTRELDGDDLVLIYFGSTSRLKRICDLPE